MAQTPRSKRAFRRYQPQRAPPPPHPCGTPAAPLRHPFSQADIEWADAILVMEDKHASRLKAQFGPLLTHKALHVLDIPDEYRFMDPELVEAL